MGSATPLARHAASQATVPSVHFLGWKTPLRLRVCGRVGAGADGAVVDEDGVAVDTGDGADADPGDDADPEPGEEGDQRPGDGGEPGPVEGGVAGRGPGEGGEGASWSAHAWDCTARST